MLPVLADSEIHIDCSNLSSEEIISKAIMDTYEVVEDDERFRKKPDDFEKQRGNYPLRREFNAYSLVLENAEPTVKRILRKMGFKVI
jgi:erythronate-4-phosphate dehydrogenase